MSWGVKKDKWDAMVQGDDLRVYLASSDSRNGSGISESEHSGDLESESESEQSSDSHRFGGQEQEGFFC